MSNRVYLYCTEFAAMPMAAELDAFFAVVGSEYEAAESVPLFWLCLFGEEDIREAQPDATDEAEPAVEQAPYPYLLCERLRGLQRLRQRQTLLGPALGARQADIYARWIARLEAEPFRNVIVRTEELAAMSEPGELARDLCAALRQLEVCAAAGALAFNDALSTITLVPDVSLLKTCEPSLLVGAVNDKERWPLSVPAPQGQGPEKPPNRPRWQFWR